MPKPKHNKTAFLSEEERELFLNAVNAPQMHIDKAPPADAETPAQKSSDKVESPRDDTQLFLDVMHGKARVDILSDASRKYEQPKGSKKASVKSAGARMTPSIDLHGLTREKAVQELRMFLQSAVRAGVREVLVIHGKGTGVLRDEVQSYLQSHLHVRQLRTASPKQGGSGATIVELK